MDTGESNPAGLPKCTATLSVSKRNSIAGRFLTHISRETSSGRFIPEMDALRFAAIGMVICQVSLGPYQYHGVARDYRYITSLRFRRKAGMSRSSAW